MSWLPLISALYRLHLGPRYIVAGDPEPASLYRDWEHRRILAEEARQRRAAGRQHGGGEGLVVRLRRAVGLA